MRRPIIVGDPQHQGAAPLDCLERAEPLGLGPEQGRRSLCSDLQSRVREPNARRSRVSKDTGQRGVEALGRAPDALDRASHLLQPLAGGGELLVGTRAVGFEGGGALARSGAGAESSGARVSPIISVARAQPRRFPRCYFEPVDASATKRLAWQGAAREMSKREEAN